jgi:hypothetical protein
MLDGSGRDCRFSSVSSPGIVLIRALAGRLTDSSPVSPHGFFISPRGRPWCARAIRARPVVAQATARHVP